MSCTDCTGLGSRMRLLEMGGSTEAFSETYIVTGSALNVASGSSVSVVSFIPVEQVFIQRVQFSGTNIANYKLMIDGNPVSTHRTWFSGAISGRMEFDGYKSLGIAVPAGKVVSLIVENFRPSIGNFEADIQWITLGV